MNSSVYFCCPMFLVLYSCSRFLFELAQIPDFAGRARCIIFQSAFGDGITSIQRKLNTVSRVCEVGKKTLTNLNLFCVSQSASPSYR